MKNAAYLVLLYGVFLLVGGIMGYAKSHSMASLVMGSLSAFLVLLGSFGMLKGHSWGFYLAFIMALLLLFLFGYRYLQSGKFYPPGILSIASFIMAAILLAVKWKR